MKDFDNMIQGLRKETKVPDEVWTKYTETLSNLPDQTENRRSDKKHWMKYTAVAAAAAITVTTICFADPAFAAKIPILGRFSNRSNSSPHFRGI